MSATVGPPPLLFGQRSPSPPSFASPPQSQTPVASPPETSLDVDMSSSSTLPPPNGQNHDRDADALMQDPDTLANGHVESVSAGTNSSQQPAAGVAVQVAAIDDDAMDTSPDNSQDLVLPNGSAGQPEARSITESSPAPDHTNGEAPREAAGENAPPAPPGDASADPHSAPSLDPPPPTDPSLVPPPPPPEHIRSDSDSSDDDDDQPWYPLHDDPSTPDEDELKAIEAAGEHSALDEDYWWTKATPELSDPEHSLAGRGIIKWEIDNYNGTRENPNKEVVMKSEAVSIGGYEWQIKFYPRGNNTDYLSIYIECLSFSDHTDSDKESTASRDGTPIPDSQATEQNTTSNTTLSADVDEPQHTPLPLLDSISVPKRKSIAAQISVVVYNPDEPRVNQFRTCSHRFCSTSSDWGWTRYHGPYTEIAHRARGQRQALLRKDRLSFIGYIQIVEDDTGCLWEHASRDSPWDSFAMTGLQSLAIGDCPGRERSPSGGNMISAVASWLLFKPFRQFLYSCKIPSAEEQPFLRPKPLVAAFQKVLFMLRTQVKPGSQPVTLEDVMDALDYYGIHRDFHKLDVIGVWEVLRLKLEEELRDTPHARALEDLFGPKKDFSRESPSYRVPITGISSMQEAIDLSPNFLQPSQSLPQLLTVELERQEFDMASRSYVKTMNKVSMDEHITVRHTSYTLFGFVVHKQTLQSYLYHPVIRPEGPGSKWYSYTDGREENMVKCLTQREAVEQHEGKSGSGRLTGNDSVAYIALYIRNDVSRPAFTSDADSEKWEVPGWLRDQVQKDATAVLGTDMDDDAMSTPETEQNIEEDSAPAKPVVFRVIDSKAFLQHEGPGLLDTFDSRWDPGSSDLVYSVTLEAADNCKDIREKLAKVLPDIKDPRQIKFWFLDALQGSFGRPNLHGTGQVEFSSGNSSRYIDRSSDWTLQDSDYFSPTYSIWTHVVDFADLPELPKEEPNTPGPVPTSESGLERQSEDTPMSEPDEPVPPPPEAYTPGVPPHAERIEQGSSSAALHHDPSADIAMVEVEEVSVNPNAAADVVVIPVVDGGAIPVPTIPVPYAVPPPPLFSGMHADLMPPPITGSGMTEPPPDEIYFFLKTFDAETQTLRSCGTHIALRSAKVDSTVMAKLGLTPADGSVEIVEEEDLTTTRPLRAHRSFATNDLHNTAIIIAFKPLTDARRDALADKAAFADVDSFLRFRALARNFPGRLNGHITTNYFSAQYYRGDIKNGQRHGHGTRIYHSGATYEGSFRLGKRHGHGLLTYQNGDTYDGHWVADERHGSGTFVEASNGNKYVGDWMNDKKFGEGVTHWKKAQEAERVCRICWFENADAAFYDCGHVVACLTCAKQMNSCPVCRKRVVSAMKLYYVA